MIYLSNQAESTEVHWNNKVKIKAYYYIKSKVKVKTPKQNTQEKNHLIKFTYRILNILWDGWKQRDLLDLRNYKRF